MKRPPNRNATRKPAKPRATSTGQELRPLLDQLDSAGPLDALRILREIREAADRAIAGQLPQARAAGASWSTIGGALRMSGQGAQQLATRRSTSVERISAP